ncbi:MAG: hypothetical protein Q9N68_10470 [Gammaproteobacteria bacterium]|nr:hypothetical protein [Gammaproteobacteria bacterium]
MKTQIRRAASMAAYEEMLKQALYEVDDLRAAIEFDGESMSSSFPLLAPIETELKALLKAIEEGSHQFSGQDLAIMPLVKQSHISMLPFKFLLTQINETHTQGLEEAD